MLNRHADARIVELIVGELVEVGRLHRQEEGSFLTSFQWGIQGREDRLQAVDRHAVLPDTLPNFIIRID